LPATSPDDRSPAARLVDALALPSVAVDQGGRVLAWNDAAGMQLAITAGAAGATLEELRLVDHAERATRLPVAGAGGAADGEGGAALLLVWRPSPRLDPVDLELQRARLVARIAPGVAHDVANSLAGVSGFAGLLREDPAVVAEYGDETLALLESGGQAAMGLVRGLTALARDGRPGTEPVDVDALLADVLLLVDHHLVDVRLDLDVPVGLPGVEANRAGLRQALTTIVLNGLEALRLPRPAGSLAVTARLVAHGDAPVVELAFEDDAPTVPPGDRVHLFDAQPPHGCIGRAGLDLAAARQLLEADGGTLRYEEGTDGRNRLVATLTPAGPGMDREPSQRG
jgi:signal transduction histidine kinase